MKGVNLKKIGAVVAGATILASSLAFAGGLFYGNTQLGDDNGPPLVKIVAGANAAASDGVAAANIAAHIANEAYKSDTLTAKVVGTATCETGNASGVGSCEILDKTVTLEVTAPGAATSGLYNLKTLIGDRIDRTLEDRDKSNTMTYDMGSDITVNANPFTDGASSSMNNAPSETRLFKIDGSMFAPLADYTVTDDQASKTYHEKQYVWVGGATSKVNYVESEDKLGATVPLLAYSMKFAGADDELGIPVCTKATNSTHYETCADTDDATKTHKVQVMFLGDYWIISDMEAPTTTGVTSESTVSPGGFVKLAKESVSGIVNVGDSLPVDDLEFRLDDISTATGTANVHPAIISVIDANGAILKQDQVNPGTTKDVNVEGYGIYKLHVYKTAPGYTFGAKWADMAVFAEEIEIRDNANLDPDLDENPNWRATVGWKNKGASSSDGQVDHWRTAVLYTDDSEDYLDDTLYEGDSVPVVEKPQAWDFTFNGIDLTSDDYDSVKFKLYTENKSFSSIYNGTGDTTTCNFTAPYVKITTSRDSGFQFTGSYNKEANYKEAYALTSGALCDDGSTLANGTLMMKESSSSSANYAVLAPNTNGVADIKYERIGDGSNTWANGGVIRANGGVIRVVNATGLDSQLNRTGSSLNYTNANVIAAFAIAEEAGVGVSAQMPDTMSFGLKGGATPTFQYDPVTTNTDYQAKDKVYYQVAGPALTNKLIEEGYITERGSEYQSTDDTTVSFKLANKLAHAQFTLASLGESTAANTVTLAGMHEGDEKTVSGTAIKVKVVSINVKLSACTLGAGTTPMCTPNMAGVSASMADSSGANMGASVETSVPYKLSGNLVVLDTDAAAVDTGTVVTVGGPVVNTVTEAALEGSDVDLATDKVVVKDMGNGKIVVAGYSAEDTLTAAEEFIGALQRQ